MIHNDLQDYSFDLPHRILVVNRGSLLDEGVVSLMSSRSNLEVSIINFEGEDGLVNNIVSSCPDTVVMGLAGNIKIKKLYKLLTSIPSLAKLQMIIFHSNDNSIDIFSREHLNLTRSEEFIALVQRA